MATGRSFAEYVKNKCYNGLYQTAEDYVNETWDTMDVFQRREYVQDPDGPLNVKGTVRRETVTNIEIWCECFGKAKEDIRPSDSYAIASIMTRFGEWERTTRSVRLPIYGKQRVYQRR